MMRIPHSFAAKTLVASVACSLLSACGNSTARLESDMKVAGEMKLEGDLKGAMKIEGPIEITMRIDGPSVEYNGVYISETLLERVTLNETRADWLLAVLGEPTGQHTLDDGSEIWKWAYVPVRQKSGSMITFLSWGEGGKNEPKIQTSTTFAHLRDGIVVEKWRD